MHRKLSASFHILIIALSLIAFSGCGSGGGGDIEDFESTAQLSLRVNPRSIDTGEIFFVTARVSDVPVDGVLVKIRYPSGIQYVPNKTGITVNGERETYTSTVSEHLIDESNYLVFQLRHFEVVGVDEFTLDFRLMGVLPVRDGFIEGDVDVNFGSSFDPAQPGFTTLDEVGITVVE